MGIAGPQLDRSVQRLTSNFPSDKSPNNFEKMAAPFPEIKSAHSLVAKHVTPEKWEKLAEHKTATLDSLWQRLLLALLNLTINIVAFMLEMRIPMLILLMSLLPSFVSTMVWMKNSNILQTWTLPRSRAISTPMHQSSLLVSVLAEASTVLDCLLESPKNNDWRLRIS